MELLTLKEGARRTGYRSTRGFLYFADRVGLRIYSYADRIRRVDAEELERVISAQALQPDDVRERVREIAARRQRRPAYTRQAGGAGVGGLKWPPPPGQVRRPGSCSA